MSLTSNFGSVTPHHHKLCVYGTKATFEQSHTSTSFFFSRDPSVKPEKVDTPYPGTQKGDLLYNFVDSIIEEKQPLIKAQEVLDAMSVGLAIDKSIVTGTPQKIFYHKLNDF